MLRNQVYTSLESQRRMLGISFRQILLIYLILHSAVEMTYAQDYPGEYDEILIYMSVPNIGGAEFNSVIKDEQLYLPVTDLFDFLRIRNIPDANFDSIKGFINDPSAIYTIDRINNSILFNDKLTGLDTGSLIRTETNLYLRSDYFRIFGFNCTFNFRDLTVRMVTNIELPAIREMRQEEMRKNLRLLKGDLAADTTIGRKYPLFHFGMADWSVFANEHINGSSEGYSNKSSEARVNLGIGTMIAGGEMNAYFNYSTSEPFKEKQQYYRWRYADNDNKFLRQVIAGKIAANLISTVYSPIVGVQFTNTPTTFRRSFGSYTLADKTEPDWMVELYVNNVLLDYVKADASGFFTFEVPLVYGNTHVVLKFYGPWGEERTQEQNIIIPFNFIPQKSLEYTISGGVVEDTLLSKFSRASFNYGLTRTITIGAGMEYLSSISSQPAMPYLNASVRLASNFLLFGEYAPEIRTKGNLSVRLPSRMQFEIEYTKYDKDQKAVNYNYDEQRKASLSIPFRTKNLMVYNRFSVDQIVLPKINYTTGEWMISGSMMGINASLSTLGLFAGEMKPYVYSNLSLGFKLPASVTVIPQAQYSYTNNTLISAKVRMEKLFLKKAFLTLGYERNFRSNMNLGDLGLRYDFNFAQTGASARRSENTTSFGQYARGSLINSRKTSYLGTDNRTNVGRGGISIIPFLDKNSDGSWDAGEPRVHGLNIHSTGGRVEYDQNDTIIRVLGLEPYTYCFIEPDQASLDNIAWRINKRNVKVAVDPNMLKLIELPVSIVGEAAGKILIAEKGDKSGLDRMIVNIYSRDQKLVGKVLSEDDGYFSYFGLTPGQYTARLDTAQLNKLGMLADTNSLDFNIAQTIDGDYIDGIDFTVRLETDSPELEFIAAKKQEVPDTSILSQIKDTSYIIVHEAVRELVTITEDGYALQLGAFLRRDYAEAYRSRIEKLTNKKVEIVLEDGFYKLRIMDISDRQDADKYIAILKDEGISQVWLLTLKAMSTHLLLTQKPDTLLSVPAPADTGFVSFYTDMAIQVGAFRNEAYAKLFREKIAFMINKNVTIVKEDGWNKVRISGFTSAEDLEKHLPALGLNGVRDMWIVSVKKPESEELVAQKPSVTEKPVIAEKPILTGKPSASEKPSPSLTFKPEIKESEKPVLSVNRDTFVTENREKPVIVQPVTTPVRPVEQPDSTKLPLDQPGAPVQPPEPTISLQVALFNKRNLAERAQKRITDKLHLPVEIVEQWGYYKVIVTGFYTREETYKYYPELAGLGYPNITLIEEK